VRLVVFPLSKCPCLFVPIAIVPSVGDTVEALNDLCTDLAATLKKIANLSVELSSRDHIRVNNILEVGIPLLCLLWIFSIGTLEHQIVDVVNIEILQDLDIGQKRALICRELTKLLQEARSEAQNWLGKSTVHCHPYPYANICHSYCRTPIIAALATFSVLYG
jgi:hypothetical protein